MDHHDHSSHGHDDDSMPMTGCVMNMLWNTQIENTCIVFESWHISSNTSFVISCLIIVGLGVLFEYLRAFQKALDYKIALSLGKGKRKVPRSGRSTPEDGEREEAGLLSGTILKASSGTPVPFMARVLRALVYGLVVFLSFFLMLVFMTYNAYLIFSVVAGAVIGHFIFSNTINIDAVLSDSAKGMACH
ncbi:Ctr copper transporter family-domain-containing protein [Mycena floridula]|nr:Ctr copper transporter family-domain-containing protein [Mycena floridula]